MNSVRMGKDWYVRLLGMLTLVLLLGFGAVACDDDDDDDCPNTCLPGQTQDDNCVCSCPDGQEVIDGECKATTNDDDCEGPLPSAIDGDGEANVGDTAGLSVDLAGDQSATWSADGGSLSGTSGDAVDLTCEEEGDVTVTAEVSCDVTGDSATLTATVSCVRERCSCAGAVAIAEAPEQVLVNEEVTVTGDTSGTGECISDVEWTVSGPGGFSASGSGDSVTFTPDAPGDYNVEIASMDGSQTCGSDSITVSAAQVPVCPDDFALEGATGNDIAIDACGVTDDQTPTYAWTCEDALENPVEGALSDDTACNPTFTPPSGGVYTCIMEATDPDDFTCDTVVTITVNTAPVAGFTIWGLGTANDELTVENCQPVRLVTDGTGDADNDSLTYTWTVTDPGGTPIDPPPTGQQPFVELCMDGTWTIQLDVEDPNGGGDSDSQTIQVSTGNDFPPIADVQIVRVISDDQTAKSADIVYISGAGSYDLLGDALTFGWTVSVGGNPVPVAEPNAPITFFEADQDEEYTIALTVTDPGSNTGTAQITYNAGGSENGAPVADAGSDQEMALPGDGSGLSLNWAGVGMDPDGDPLSYSWTLTKPAGSAAELENPSASNAQFVADIPGWYNLCLTVNDGNQDSATDCAWLIVLASGEGTLCQYADAAWENAGTLFPATYHQVPTIDINDANPEVQLNSLSYDPLGRELGYQWTLIVPPTDPATDMDRPTRSRNALELPDENPEWYWANLFVYDKSLLIDRNKCPWVQNDYIAIEVVNFVPPTICTEIQSCALEGGTISGTACVADVDSCLPGDVCEDKMSALTWTLLEAPEGSTATLDNTSGPSASFTADVAGNYTLRFCATDVDNLTTCKTYEVEVKSSETFAGICGGQINETQRLRVQAVNYRTGDPIGNAPVFIGEDQVGSTGEDGVLEIVAGAAPSLVSQAATVNVPGPLEAPLDLSVGPNGYVGRTLQDLNSDEVVVPLKPLADTGEKTIRGTIASESWTELGFAPDLLNLTNLLTSCFGAIASGDFENPCVEGSFQIEIGVTVMLQEGKNLANLTLHDFLAGGIGDLVASDLYSLCYTIPGNLSSPRPVLDLGPLVPILGLLGVFSEYNPGDPILFGGKSKAVDSFQVQVPAGAQKVVLGSAIGLFNIDPTALTDLLALLVGGGGGLDSGLTGLLAVLDLQLYHFAVGEFDLSGGTNLGEVKLREFSNTGNHLFWRAPYQINQPNPVSEVVPFDPPTLIALAPGVAIPLPGVRRKALNIQPLNQSSIFTADLPPNSAPDERLESCGESVPPPAVKTTPYCDAFDDCSDGNCKEYSRQIFDVTRDTEMESVTVTLAEFGEAVPWAEGMMMPVAFSFGSSPRYNLPELDELIDVDANGDGVLDGEGDNPLAGGKLHHTVVATRGLVSPQTDDNCGKPPVTYLTSSPGQMMLKETTTTGGGANLTRALEFPNPKLQFDDSGMECSIPESSYTFEDRRVVPKANFGCFHENGDLLPFSLGQGNVWFNPGLKSGLWDGGGAFIPDEGLAETVSITGLPSTAITAMTCNHVAEANGDNIGKKLVATPYYGTYVGTSSVAGSGPAGLWRLDCPGGSCRCVYSKIGSFTPTVLSVTDSGTSGGFDDQLLVGLGDRLLSKGNPKTGTVDQNGNEVQFGGSSVGEVYDIAWDSNGAYAYIAASSGGYRYENAGDTLDLFEPTLAGYTRVAVDTNDGLVIWAGPDLSSTGVDLTGLAQIDAGLNNVVDITEEAVFGVAGCADPRVYLVTDSRQVYYVNGGTLTGSQGSVPGDPSFIAPACNGSSAAGPNYPAGGIPAFGHIALIGTKRNVYVYDEPDDANTFSIDAHNCCGAGACAGGCPDDVDPGPTFHARLTNRSTNPFNVYENLEEVRYDVLIGSPWNVFRTPKSALVNFQNLNYDTNKEVRANVDLVHDDSLSLNLVRVEQLREANAPGFDTERLPYLQWEVIMPSPGEGATESTLRVPTVAVNRMPNGKTYQLTVQSLQMDQTIDYGNFDLRLIDDPTATSTSTSDAFTYTK